MLEVLCLDVGSDELNRYICRKPLGCTFKICAHSISVLYELKK